MIYIALFGICCCIIIMLYMVKEAFENNVLYHEVQLRGKGKQENFTLFFISDIHVRKVNEKMIKKISNKVDAVIIGGDFADKRTPIYRIYNNIKVLKSLGPIYFVWGNNDREVGESRLRKIFEETDVQIIENESVLLNENVRLAGVDFSAKNIVPYDQTFKYCTDKDVIIFIAHNPQVFPKVLKQQRVDLLMGGHLHGGQIRFGPFGIHPPGSFSIVDGIATLISNGYGTTLLPLRFGAKPQCHIIEVKFTS
ncbi:putative MPP superfamily phosphohydrolase OS=Ureibacillus acetophenoni OX=614649 GN=SAMN05877842_103350 PE=4 SV=1 [Ureibacillus acetophenoni]